MSKGYSHSYTSYERARAVPAEGEFGVLNPMPKPASEGSSSFDTDRLIPSRTNAGPLASGSTNSGKDCSVSAAPQQSCGREERLDLEEQMYKKCDEWEVAIASAIQQVQSLQDLYYDMRRILETGAAEHGDGQNTREDSISLLDGDAGDLMGAL
ncbi:MAG: hypothetical protein Q9184_001892 [Pyrenodesmia sp. 2 TL-2023]